jgi:hypothetical protein
MVYWQPTVNCGGLSLRRIGVKVVRDKYSCKHNRKKVYKKVGDDLKSERDLLQIVGNNDGITREHTAWRT